MKRKTATLEDNSLESNNSIVINIDHNKIHPSHKKSKSNNKNYPEETGEDISIENTQHESNNDHNEPLSSTLPKTIPESPSSSSSSHDSEPDNEIIHQMTNSEHVKAIIQLTIPVVLSEIFQNTLPLIDLAFVGNLGKIELAAAALATVWFNLWNATMQGFLSAIDTLLAQSCGAKQWEIFGMWTGISLIVTLGVTFLIAALNAMCGPVMVLFGQDVLVAKLAGDFTFRLLPGLFPYYISKVLIKYLQSQNILLPSVIIGILANIFNVIFNQLLIHKFGMGLNGAPWATTLTRTVQLLMIIGYMFLKRNKTLKESWPTFDRSTTKKLLSYTTLKPFWKLSIAGALSLSCEAWSFEITIILAGLLGTVELDAHSITLSVAAFIFFSFPFAIGIATSIRVGQLIGEKRAKEARRSFKVSIAFALLVQTIILVILIPCGPSVGKLFSSDEEVANLVAKLIPISAVFLVGDAVQGNVAGACRGLGRQRLNLKLNVFGFWILGVPIGAILTFVVPLGVSGLWWGFNIGIYSAASFGLVFLLFRINWTEESRTAMRRISSVLDFPIVS